MPRVLQSFFEQISKHNKTAIRNFIAPAPCPILKNFHITDHGHIHMKDCDELAQKIQHIKLHGPKSLQIMTDYDKTLTKMRFIDGKYADTSFKALQESAFITKEVKLIARQLFEKYHKIELDLSMPSNVKSQHMMDWWESKFKHFIQMGLKHDDHGHIVLNSRLLFRHGILDLLRIGSKLELPFYIVSGGITEIIESHFQAILHNGEAGEAENELREYWDSSVKVLSNRFIYANTIGIDYQKPIIHVLNKQQFIYDTEPKREFKRNVIVMGDLLEDVQMVRESEHDVVLKVGFLNDLEVKEDMMAEFMKTFDVVITGDGSLQAVNYLLSQIFNEELKQLKLTEKYDELLLFESLGLNDSKLLQQ
ncbi:hypothetical protein FGO68_gene11395 [Halteria grandinella]|uniref:5'-nucleotidase n=1 Tax=Halteria grandinella TaxID=5974 RepID=A0A8J8T092_HALGN|nr:hypothetical protein FGO68_gene11395 [Halteria grandinella]